MSLTQTILRNAIFFVWALTFISCSAKETPMKHPDNLKQPQPPLSVEESNPKSAGDKSSEIISAILPNDFADANELEKFASDDVIKALQLIEADANQTRTLGIAYIFVVLKHDAAKNSAKIGTTLRECGRRGIGLENANDCEAAANYGMDLFDRGDKAFLNPLLDVGLKSDGALSEGLGVFFAAVLQKEPERFLQTLLKRPVREQRELA